MKVASVPSLIRSGGVVRDGSAKVMVGSAWGSKEGNGSDGVGMPRHQAESAPCRRRKRAKRKKQSPIRLNRLKFPFERRQSITGSEGGWPIGSSFLLPLWEKETTADPSAASGRRPARRS